MSRLEQQRFTISEVAADWHELVIPWRIMRPSIEQLDQQCSIQTYHRPTENKSSAENNCTHRHRQPFEWWSTTTNVRVLLYSLMEEYEINILCVRYLWTR